MHKLFFLFFLTQLAFSQSKNDDLVQLIYTSTETFSENANLEKLKILEQKEKTFQPKTKAEFLAMVYLLCNKSYYLKNINQTEKAITNYEKAWQIYQRKVPNEGLKTYDIIEYCLKPLGNLYTNIGDYDNAQNIIKSYFYIANQENNLQHKFSAIINLTNVFLYAGKNQEAINLLQKTLETEKLSITQKGILWNSLGNNYLVVKEKNKAEKCYENSITFFKNTTDKKILSNSLRNLALIKNDLFLFKNAKELFTNNKNNTPREIAKLYLDEATLLFQNNKISETQIALQEVFKTLIPKYKPVKNVLPNQNSLYAETIFIDALDLQATLLTLQNQPKKALKCYKLSFHVDTLLQSLLVYENSKIVNQINVRSRTEKCIAIYNNLFQIEKKQSYIEEAFLLQEQSKSAVLKSYISDKKTQSKEEKLLHEQLQNWNNVILKEQQKVEYADIEKINQAIKEQNKLMLLLKARESSTSAYRYENSFVVEKLYEKLENDKAVFVEYFFGFSSIYIFTIENKKIKLNFINNSNSARPKIGQFLDYFTDAQKITDDVSGYIHCANLVYKMLKLPQKTTYKNLVVVPDGILNFVPFEALITKKTSTTNFSKMNYLIKDFCVSYSNSASFYTNSLPLKTDKETVLGIFPVFKNKALELTYSVDEMKAIQKLYDGNYFQNHQATFSNFKKNATINSILHLSTHASSGDVFDPASIMFVDDNVMYSEFYNLNIHPNLVVLSACETGLGKLYKSEGAMSVARGFQFAGAQNLYFSLWKVNDFTTSVLMSTFYKNIKKGKSFAQANHDAKVSFLNDFTISNTKKSPYYWSAFVYFGTLENNHSSTNYQLWIFGLIGLITLFLLLRKSFVTKFLT